MSKMDILKNWLRDAYAMEAQSVEALSRHVSRNEHYPILEEQVKKHLVESEQQKQKIHDCLKSLGEDVSFFKTAAGKLVGNLQGIATIFAGDEIIKTLMMFYMHEHYEIAAYRIIIAAAKDCGQGQIVQTCEAILKEEEAMQGWLKEYMEPVTQQYLFLETSGSGAQGAAKI